MDTRVNFGATMDIKAIKTNAKRWNEIAQLYEKRTKEFPHDGFRLTELPDGLEAYNFNKKTNEEIVVGFVNENVDKLMNFTNEQIVSKFKKLLKISAEKGEVYEETNNFLKKLESKKIDDLDEEIWDLVCDKAEQKAAAAKDKDAFLRDIDIRF